MFSRPPKALGVLVIGCFLAGLAAIAEVRATTPQDAQLPNFPVTLQGDRIQFGSPTLADITGDGRPEIIVGGSDGVIHAVAREGRILWQFRTDDAFNNVLGIAKRSATTIRSVPAVGDLDGDGKVEIVVGVGDVESRNQNGGVVVLRNDGTLYPGWPQLSGDHQPNGAGDGYTDGVVSSPSIGDVTGDGKPEIVYGNFDHNVYVKQPNGQNVAGWPRFVRDTVWSSPALADLDRDGRNDIVIGIDAHRDDLNNDLEGGYVLAMRGDATDLPGWRQHQDDAVFSAPAVADLDGDGSFEVIVGGSGYYASLRQQPFGRYVTAYRSNGTQLWRVTAAAVISSSPAIGDVDGDKSLDVVVCIENGQVMAVSGKDGRTLWTVSVDAARFIIKSPVLGDYDGDGLDDVFVTQGFDVVPLKGTNGQRLAEAYTFTGNFTVDNTAALGDLDGNGKLELISAAGTRDTEDGRGQIYAWTLPSSTGKATWPILRGDPAHTARIGQVVPQQPPTTTTTPLPATATVVSTTASSPTTVSSPTAVGATATSTATTGAGGTATATTTSGTNFKVYLPFVATSGTTPVGTLTPTGTVSAATATQSSTSGTPTTTGTAATPTAADTVVTPTTTGTTATPSQTVTGTPPTGTPTAAGTATTPTDTGMTATPSQTVTGTPPTGTPTAASTPTVTLLAY